MTLSSLNAKELDNKTQSNETKDILISKEQFSPDASYLNLQDTFFLSLYTFLDAKRV